MPASSRKNPTGNHKARHKSLISMDYKKDTGILIKMIDKYSLEGEEKEAVLEAVGMLSWASLSQSRLKNLKEKRDKNPKR